MKTYRKINFLWLLSVLPFAAGLQAQVSVGSLLPSEQAAFLQIKEYNATIPGDATADKGGLLLPRVAITDVTDVTVVVPNANADQKAALTGLLVYNVGTTGNVEEGICEWNGSEWILLETESKTTGSNTKKAVTRISTQLTEKNTPKVQIGIFEFRMRPPDGTNIHAMPQIQLAKKPDKSISVWYHIARFWDYNEPGDASGSNINGPPPYVGYTYEAKSWEFEPKDYAWKVLHTGSLPKDDVRYEVWVADPTSDHVYNVHFIYAKHGLSMPFYAVIATEY
jgi:hypothetical protein